MRVEKDVVVDPCSWPVADEVLDARQFPRVAASSVELDDGELSQFGNGQDMWFIGTPSNFWPSDRSWFVYTDWDLWGTKVSGPAVLINAIRSDPNLETLDWQAP